MGCRIGMTTDVAARVRELKDEGLVPEQATHRILDECLTYEEANEKEEALRFACGRHCDGHSGGRYKGGRVWSVYRIDW